MSSVFSTVRNDDELRAATIAREVLGEDVHVSISSEIGSMGLIERENATILNAALYDVARTTADSFEAALASEGLADVAVYLGQNDGTLMSVDYAKRYPIFTIACGPTNSIRGASFLTQEKDAVVSTSAAPPPMWACWRMAFLAKAWWPWRLATCARTSACQTWCPWAWAAARWCDSWTTAV